MVFDEVYKLFLLGIESRDFSWYQNGKFLERLDAGNGLFRPVLGESFCNWHWLIRRRFRKLKNSRNNIKALYTEINGFYINPHNWGYHLDGHIVDEGAGNLEWLSRPACWTKPFWLMGFDKTNDAYESYEKNEMWSDGRMELARDMANLVVGTSFLAFMDSVLANNGIGVPVYVGIHDFDLAMRIPG